MELALLVEQRADAVIDSTFRDRHREDGVVTAGEGIDDLAGEPGGGVIENRDIPLTAENVHTFETVNTAGGELAGQSGLGLREHGDARGAPTVRCGIEEEVLATLNITIAGSSDNEAKALTVIPTSTPPSWVVTTVTPEGKVPTVARNCSPVTVSSAHIISV